MARETCFNCSGSGTVAIEQTGGSAPNYIACPACGGGGTLHRPDPARPVERRGGRSRGGGAGGERSGWALPESVQVYLGMMFIIWAWVAMFTHFVLGYHDPLVGISFVVALALAIPATASRAIGQAVVGILLGGFVVAMAWGALNVAGYSFSLPGAAVLFLILAAGVMTSYIGHRQRERRGG